MNDLWQQAVKDLDEGNFTSLQNVLGGPDGFDSYIVEWHKSGRFDGHSEMLAETLTCACMLGRTETAAYLLDNGVDPYLGMRTGLAGPHYAASGGHLDTVKMLLGKNIPLEIENGYGGTMLGQALWSAINEHKDSHTNVIELLIESGAYVWPETLEWWNEQAVPSADTKQRVADILKLHAIGV